MVAVIVALTIFIVAFVPYASSLAATLIRVGGMNAKRE